MNPRVILFDWGGTLAKSGKRAQFLYNDDVSSQLSVLWPDSLEVLEELQSRGYVLGIVSNTNHHPYAMYRALANTKMQQFFGVVVLDSEANMCSKPCGKLFLEASRRVGVKPDHCLYVGNDFFQDIWGANQIGMQSVWLDTVGAEGKYRHRYPKMLLLKKIPIINTLSGLLSLLPVP